MESLLLERKQLVKESRRNRRVAQRLFCSAHKRASHYLHWRACEHEIDVIDWRINQLNGRELTRPMPQPLPLGP